MPAPSLKDKIVDKLTPNVKKSITKDRLKNLTFEELKTIQWAIIRAYKNDKKIKKNMPRPPKPPHPGCVPWP